MYAIIINNQIFAACETQVDVDGYLRDNPTATAVSAPEDFTTYEYKYVGGSLTKKTISDYEYEQQLSSVQSTRQVAYPSIGDQLDALWKGGDAAAEMLAKVQAVKAKYPKPTE
jgi:hypothetical protein